MKLKRLLSIAFLLASTTIVIQSCEKEDDKDTNTVTDLNADDNTFKDFMTWTKVDTRKGADPALAGMAHGGNDTSVTRNIYVKNNQKAVNGKYPVGTIIVKHSSNTAGSVNEYTAMVKRAAGFDAAASDWEYFMLNPTNLSIGEDGGNKMRGSGLMGGMCKGCHAGATVDYVFTQK